MTNAFRGVKWWKRNHTIKNLFVIFGVSRDKLSYIKFLDWLPKTMSGICRCKIKRILKITPLHLLKLFFRKTEECSSREAVRVQTNAQNLLWMARVKTELGGPRRFLPLIHSFRNLMKSFTEKKLTALMIAICFIYVIGNIPQIGVMILQNESVETMYSFQVSSQLLFKIII